MLKLHQSINIVLLGADTRAIDYCVLIHFQSINVMDYSLLVGVDTQRQELACGIIDYLRQYTWDKQLENWVKSSLVLPKNQLPTIISPKEYKKRFRKFISTYFLSVPDNWCSQRSSNPCKLCGPWVEYGSLHRKPQKRGNQDEYCSYATSQKQGKHEAGSFVSWHDGKRNGFIVWLVFIHCHFDMLYVYSCWSPLLSCVYFCSEVVRGFLIFIKCIMCRFYMRNDLFMLR